MNQKRMWERIGIEADAEVCENARVSGVNRPYFRLATEELEALFHAERTSLATLLRLREELMERAKPRARQLLAEVEIALGRIDGSQRPQDHAEVVDEPSTVKNDTITSQQPASEVAGEGAPRIPPLVMASAAMAVVGTTAEAARRQAILSYWRAVEVFNPQQTPRIDPRSKEDPVYECGDGLCGPWEPGHSHRSRRAPQNCLWRFIVYGGIFPTRLISERLEEVFGRDADVFDERADGASATFALALTHRGEPLIESFVLSSAAWALGRLRQPGPDSSTWLNGFEAVETHVRKYLENLFVDSSALQPSEPLIGRETTTEELRSVSGRILEHLGLEGLAFTTNLVVRCQLVSFRKYKNTDDLDVLNSFFVRDLQRVTASVAVGQCGSALAAYLQAPEADVSSRVDVRKQDPKALCWEKLEPVKFPQTRWPSEGHHPLVYSQQIAVNELLERLKSSGLFGINGPPGTGKTTLLRDVVAGVILDRAKALAKLSRPEAAFAGHDNWKTDKYTRRISFFVPPLQGFGMVVASANNGAVENVTLELPGESAIDESWRGAADYFSEKASRLLGTPAWGLIAARLGNKANRREFLSKFWFDDEEQPQSQGFLSYLKNVEGIPVDWNAAVRNFTGALEAEGSVRRERQRSWEAVVRLNQLEGLHREKTDLAGVLDERRREALSTETTAQSEADRCVNVLETARSDRLRHRAFLPAWWMVLYTFGKAYREWRGPDAEYQRRILEAEFAVGASQQILAVASEAHISARDAHASCAEELSKIEAELTIVRERVAQARAQLVTHFPYGSDWTDDEAVRELSAPWMDGEWALTRAQVFFAALELHRAFIHANAVAFRQNLTALSDVLGGNMPGGVSSTAVKAAWDALFFVIPVVSTTFASMDRLFPFHDKESIGWLFIDEAGQATPQAAIGAIWRAQRAVVVGDPLQLEPILSLPFTAQDSLRKHFQVAEYWRPGTLSCQRLADQASSLGTWVPTDEEPLWVGSPLRVHRRCDELMFRVSNNVAYHGLMIFGTGKRADLDCRPSVWLDVKTRGDSDSHWIPEEGEVTRGLLEELTKAGISSKGIFMISPFRTVVRELARIARDFDGLRAGTIHTVQGKEADVVILVLGGNPGKGGAKDWAAAKPNLVNVAASRAKRRLYVIGNREEWRKRRYFSTLSAVFDKLPA